MKTMGIDDILLHDETIFRNMNVFDQDYLPENFRFRESQMEALAICVRPALKNGRPVNAVVLGSCATGKTTAVKKIFEMVERNSDRVVCAYVNCQLHTTRFNIFSQIYNKIFGHLPPETGVPFSRIYQQIMQHLSQTKKALIVALDDVNYLFHSKNADKVFYDILRAQEVFPGVRTGVFAIVSDIEFRYALDKNVKSVFIPQEIVFNPYNREEIKNILTERVKVGFYPNVISEEFIDQITDETFSNGDLRVGIDLLRVSANLAEADASKSIEKRHLKESLKRSSSINLINTLKSLSNDEKIVLNIITISQEKNLTAGDLYKEFSKKSSASYSSFNRILNKMEFLRIIDTKFTGKGSKGNSRVIILRFDPKDIAECLNISD
ncbi:MAG: ORC1-type DNA replication protein [Methanomicrobiales archaeon]